MHLAQFDEKDVLIEKYQIPRDADLYWMDGQWTEAKDVGPSKVLKIVKPPRIVAIISRFNAIMQIFQSNNPNQVMIDPTAKGKDRILSIDQKLLEKFKVHMGYKLKG